MKFLRLLLIPFAALVVLFMRLLRPWWHIRVGMLFSSRIGHLAGNSEVYLCERDAGMHKTIDIWIAQPRIANQYLLKMLGRCMMIDRTGFFRLVYLICKLFDGCRVHDIPLGSWDRDILNLMEKHPAHFKFTASEEADGQAGLRRLGIPEGAKWVCLIVRDAAYLPELSYHDYRDSDITTYESACAALAQRGYYVVRMGAKVSKKLGFKPGGHVIDYATNGQRSEFMDVYLGAKCSFCISSGTGFDAIPYIFRRPICYVNYAPLEYLFTFVPGSMAIWKHHYKDGRRLSLQEIYESGVGQAMSSGEFKRAGITLKDNTPEEIRDVVMEMANTYKPPKVIPGYETLHIYPKDWDQSWFWAALPRLPSPHTGKPLHGEIRMRIGTKFLKAYEPASLDRAA